VPFYRVMDDFNIIILLGSKGVTVKTHALLNYYNAEDRQVYGRENTAAVSYGYINYSLSITISCRTYLYHIPGDYFIIEHS